MIGNTFLCHWMPSMMLLIKPVSVNPKARSCADFILASNPAWKQLYPYSISTQQPTKSTPIINDVRAASMRLSMENCV